MINLTEAAKAKVIELIKAKQDASFFMRFGVKGGGCSGMSYLVDLDNEIKETDRVFGEGQTKVVCDVKSALYLDNLTVDFKDALVGGGFNFINPNASGTCGCGTSFSV